MRGEERFVFECRSLDADALRDGVERHLYRIVHLQRGSLGFGERERTRRLPASRILFLPVGCRERIDTRDSVGCLFLFDAAFSARVMGLFEFSAIQRFRLDGRGEPEVSVVSLREEEGKRLGETLKALERESHFNRGTSSALIYGLFVEVITLSERLLLKPPPPGENVAAWQIRDLKEYLSTHYSDAVTLDLFAAKYGLSAGHLSRLFSQTCGVTLFEYLNRLRIEKACRLLKESGLPVIDIAGAVGYNNLSFFNRYFRRVTGMTPRDYRLRT